MAPNIGDRDLVINYAVLTPATVMWWYTNMVLFDKWVGQDDAKLLVGFISCVVVACLHDLFRRNVPTGSSGFLTPRFCYETAYDYLVVMTCSCQSIGCCAIYDLMARSSLFLGSLGIAAAAAALLVYLRGFRNVLCLPMDVDNDKFDDRYRPHSPLRFTGDMILDDVACIVLIWTPGSVVWEGLFNYLAVSSGLDQNLMVLYGYVGVFLMMTGGRAVAEHVISNISNETVKTAVEDVYVGVSLVFSAMVWKGLELDMASAVNWIGSITSTFMPGVTYVLTAHVITFAIMKYFGVTRSLYDRSCERDGAGVNFSTAIEANANA